MSPVTTEHAATTDLREYVDVARARKWQIAIVAALCLAAALLYAYRATPIYQATARVLVNSVLTSPTQVAAAQPPNMDNERTIVLSPAITTPVERQLAARSHAVPTLDNVTASVPQNTFVLEISYSSPNARTAALTANAFANQYVRFRTGQALAQLEAVAGGVQTQVNGLQSQIAGIDARIASTTSQNAATTLQAQRDSLVSRAAVLQQRLLDIQSSEALNQNAAQVVGKATVPKSPVSPRKAEDAVLGLLAGLVLGVAIAFVRERLDDRIKSRDELERRLGVPVLAAIPTVRTWRRTEDSPLVMVSEPKSPIAEAYRTLGTNVRYAASTQPLQVLMVTSALGGDGKTTTSANLAVALARTGKRVVLICADLRRPRTHAFFRLKNDAGLADAIADGVDIVDIARNPGIDNLRVVTSGPIPADPAELLSAPATRDLFAALREISDFVIVDAPPILAVADASIIAPMVDGALFVIDSQRSSRSALHQARNQLENAGANLVGGVYNNFDPAGRGGYSSNYYYYYQYYGEPETSANGNQPSNRRFRRNRQQVAEQPADGKAENGSEDRDARSRRLFGSRLGSRSGS